MRRIVALAVATFAVLTLPSGCTADYRVDVANGSVAVSREFWKRMKNPEAFAVNFEARDERSGEKYKQVLTVFKAPIRDDQRAGLELFPGTWVEFMVIHPPAITLEVRVAHTRHWVLSRQTLEKRAAARVNSEAYRPFLSTEDSRTLLSVYSDEVARTRSVLNALVAR